MKRLNVCLDWIKETIKKDPFLFVLAMKIWALGEGCSGYLASKRGAIEYLRSTWSFFVRSRYVAGRPVNVTIEPTTICNIQCSVCETGAGILERASKHMSLDQFRLIIDKLSPHINTLMFYYMGEPFMNKQSYEMIAYAKMKGVPFVTTCTNGDVVDPEKLVDSGIDEVSFQLGGMTQATHQVYRSGSNLERVIKNMEATIRIREIKRPQMKVLAGFILMRHNEHEVPEFERRMEEVGVDKAVIIDPCVRNMEQAEEMLPTDREHWYYDPDAFDRGILRPKVIPHNECPWLYYSMTIQVNGDVVPCCRDAQGKFVMGNILEQDSEAIWNGEHFLQFREMIHTNQSKVGICRLCSSYGVSRLQ
ncbi:MAG: radical SAM protein [Nitrospirota bacterium]|nr:radical SAM protein [Nitrospirota bacterium]